MDIADAVRIVNWSAKNKEKTKKFLEDIAVRGYVPQNYYFGEEVLDREAGLYGVNLYLENNKMAKATNIVGCTEHHSPESDAKCTYFESNGKCMFTYSICEICKKEGVIRRERKEPELQNIDTAIANLLADIKELYDLKHEVCELPCWEIRGYGYINGNLYKSVSFDGYLAHCPVNAQEEERIKKGDVSLKSKDSFYHENGQVHDILEEELSEAKKTIKKVLEENK